MNSSSPKINPSRQQRRCSRVEDAAVFALPSDRFLPILTGVPGKNIDWILTITLWIKDELEKEEFDYRVAPSVQHHRADQWS